MINKLFLVQEGCPNFSRMLSGFLRNHCPLCARISVRISQECCPEWPGITVRFGQEYAYDEENVEIFIGFERIAIHKRDYLRGGYTTLEEHMPEHHLRHKETLGWDAEFFISVAEGIGDCSVEVFKKVLDSREFIEQSYLSCKGLKRLSEIYGPQRFEAACRRALRGTRVHFGMIKNILEKNLDKQEDPQGKLFTIPRHDNIRGKESYQ